MRIRWQGRTLDLHSMVDVITNSSSVAYIIPHGNSLSAARSFIQQILDGVGSSVDLDECMEFTVDVENDILEYGLTDSIVERFQNRFPEMEINIEKGKYGDYTISTETWQRMKNVVNELPTEEAYDFWLNLFESLNRDDYYLQRMITIGIRFRNGVSVSLENAFGGIFNMEAVWS